MLAGKEPALRWISLLFWVALCLAVGGIGGRWTAPEIPAWYRTLSKPSFNPPNWVFGPVWTALYLLMAVAAWIVTECGDSQARTLGLSLFAVQLALNLVWPWIFFRKHALGAAAVEVVGLWCVIAATTWMFGKVSSTAAWLLVPYLAWVGFASVLNFALWQYNLTSPA